MAAVAWEVPSGMEQLLSACVEEISWLS